MKQSLDDFGLDCVMDDKMQLLEAAYGIKGYAVIIKLFQRIYGGDGYYCDWNDDVRLLFASRIGVGANLLSEIIEEAIKRGIFNKELFHKYKILTSAGIQVRFLKGTVRRKEVEMRREYLLFNYAILNKNVHLTGKNVVKNIKNVDIPEQRKVEESKGNEIKDKVEVEDLYKTYGKECIDYYIARTSDYYGYPTRNKIIQFLSQDKKNKKGFFTNTKESEIQNFDELLDKFCEVWGRRPRQQIFLI